MAIATRQAGIEWVGSLASGAGTVSVASGAFGPPLVGWAARTEQPDRKASPEELIAAAHASCFAMALSLVLSENKTPAERVAVAASCTLDEVDGDQRITTVHLNVRASVPGVDPAGFKELVERDGALCPVSGALRGNAEITVDAELER